MDIQRRLALVLVCLLSGCVTSVQQAAPESDASNGADAAILALATLLTGEFDSEKQMDEDRQANLPKQQRHGRVNRVFVRVDAPDVAEVVLVGTTRYGGAPWTFDKSEFLVWTFQKNADGIVMSPRRFKDLESRIPIAQDGEALAGFSPDELESAVSGAACDIQWQPNENGFSGRSLPCNVMSTTKHMMLNWNWSFELNQERLEIEFTGVDDKGVTQDSTPVGSPYRLDRISNVTNAVLRTATIYVKNWDASLKFYRDYLGYDVMVVSAIDKEKSLATLGARPGNKARIAYLKPNNSHIERPFAGNYLGLIEISGPGADENAYQRPTQATSAVLGEIVLAHQVVGVDKMYQAMVEDGMVIVAPLSLSGAGASRSFSVIDPNGVRVEIYEYLPGKEPTKNP